LSEGMKKASMGGLISLAVLVIAGPVFLSDYLLTMLIIAFHYAYLAQSWNLIFGYCGQLALGHSVFYGIAGYLSTKLFMVAHVTPYLGGVIGGLVAALFAFPLGVILFRSKLKGLSLAIVTIASAEIFIALFNNWEYIGGSAGIYLPLKDAPSHFMFISRLPYYYIALFMVIAMMFVTVLIERSKLGYRAIAVRENEETAEASGINSFRIKLTFFVVSAFLTGLGGTFYAQFMLYIVPDIMFGIPNLVLLPMLGVVVGGRGTIFGPIIGSLVFSILGEVLRGIPFLHGPRVSALTLLFYGLVLTIVSIRYSAGLMGFIGHLKKRPFGFTKRLKGL
jgi:branched-chain amino acid transport system permease protein